MWRGCRGGAARHTKNASASACSSSLEVKNMCSDVPVVAAEAPFTPIPELPPAAAAPAPEARAALEPAPPWRYRDLMTANVSASLKYSSRMKARFGTMGQYLSPRVCARQHTTRSCAADMSKLGCRNKWIHVSGTEYGATPKNGTCATPLCC